MTFESLFGDTIWAQTWPYALVYAAALAGYYIMPRIVPALRGGRWRAALSRAVEALPSA